MAFNVDKYRQPTEYTNTPTAQHKAAQPGASSQPIDFSSQNNSYTIKKGDNLWKVAKQQLILSGISNPTNAQINAAMEKLAKANGCSTPTECAKKFFYKVGNQLNLQGLFETPKPEPVVEETPTVPETPILTEQETKIKEELKTKFPDLGLENMSDNEVKAFLDKLKQTNPELLSALETAVSTQATEEIIPTEGVEEQKTPLTGLTDEQTQTLKEQITQYISENPEVVTERSTTPHQTVAKSEMEQLAEKIGIKGNIDEIIVELKTKQLNRAELSADEIKLLNLHKKSTQINNNQSIKAPEVKFSKDKLVMSYNELFSEDFMKKSPDEKLVAITNNYLLKNDPKYAQLPDAQKEEYLQKTLQKLISTINGGQAPSSEVDKIKTGIKAVAFMQTAYANNMSLEELAQSPKKDELVSGTVNKLLKDVFNMVSEEERAGKTNIELAHAYADKILSLTDSEYLKLTDENAKAEYRMKKIENVVSNYISEDFKSLSKEEQELKIAETLSFAKFVINKNKAEDGNLDLKKVLNMEDISGRDLLEEYIEDLRKTPDCSDKRNSLASAQARLSVYDRFKAKGIENPSMQDIKNELDKMAKEQGGKIEDPYLYRWHQELMRKEQRGALKNCKVNERTNTYDAMKAGMNVEDYMKAEIAKAKTPEEKDAVLRNMIERSQGRTDELKMLAEIAKVSGMNEQDWRALLSTSGETMEELWDKAVSAEEFNWAIVNDINKERVNQKVEASHGWYQNNQEVLVEIDSNILQNSPEYVDSMTRGMHKYGTQESNTALWKSITESGSVADANLAQGVNIFMKNAQSDDVRLDYSKSLSNIGNAAVLEGVAAASKYVSDPGIRQQYNTAVSTAAQNYPPEQQRNINSAMQTGEISSDTMAKTTPSETPASHSSSAQPATKTSDMAGSNYGQGVNTSSASKTTAPDIVTTQAAAGSSTPNTVHAATPVFTAQSANELESKRQAAMDNAKTTAQSIEEAVKDWEEKHSKKLSVEDIDAVKAAAAVEEAKEAVESAATSESEKERIIKALSNATSIGEVYDILVSALGSSRVQGRFIEKLASIGSTANIRAFIASRAGDSDSLVKQIFLRSSSSSLRRELLGMMSSDTIAELLANRQITDLTAVDQRILITYVMKNVFLMSNNEFVRFLNAIADPNEKEKLIAMRSGTSKSKNNSKQNIPAQKEQSVAETSVTSEASTVAPAPHSLAYAPQLEQAFAKEEPLVQPTSAQTRLAAGEISKDLGDGTILTREGAGFGAISDTEFDLARVVEKPKHKDGAPIGMEDDTLTVGSAEWNKKYNKNNVQSTAFTMAALEDDEDDGFGGAWFGNKGNFKGKGIKKKPFKFNA